MIKKQMSTQAQCAKMIRKELKEAFPETKFSVRSESFSGGDGVDINWTDGPTSEKVDEIVSKYQYGHFDGMTDCYEYSNCKEDIPQVKFVMTQRSMSDEVKELLIKEHNDKFCEEAQIKDYNAYNNHMQAWNNTVVYRIFNKRSF